MSNYPAGVTDNDDHFNLPSAGDERDDDSEQVFTDAHPEGRECADTACPCHRWLKSDRRLDPEAQFPADWTSAPRSMRDYVEVACAEYWWLKGRQAGAIAEIRQTNADLQQMAQLAKERLR